MADSLDPEQPTARRFGKADRSRGAGMDELLRALLPYEVHRGPAPHQRGSRRMGEREKQRFAISKILLSTLAGPARAGRPEPLVSVADWYPTVGWKVEAVEHGPNLERTNVVGCCDHAHIHVLPIAVENPNLGLQSIRVSNEILS